jgi:hypothetical protein
VKLYDASIGLLSVIFYAGLATGVWGWHVRDLEPLLIGAGMLVSSGAITAALNLVRLASQLDPPKP